MRPGGTTPDRPLVADSNNRRISAVGLRDARLERRIIPAATLPLWTPFTPTIDDGELDDTLSYGYSMVQAAAELATVAVQLRAVVLTSSGVSLQNLPGATGSGYLAPNAYILAGLAFTSSDMTDQTTMWDTAHHAYITGAGHIKYPFGDTVGAEPDPGYPDSGCAGDILFVGGGIYPYEIDEGGTPLWPSP